MIRSWRVRIFAKNVVFNALDSASFLVEADFDVAYVAGTLLAFRKERFHSMFGFYEGLRDFVVQALPNIRKAVAIANFEEFEAACMGDKTLMKRLRKTVGAMPTAFDVSRVVRLIEDQSIEVHVIGSKESPELVFDKWHKHDFFRLLEDDSSRLQ